MKIPLLCSVYVSVKAIRLKLERLQLQHSRDLETILRVDPFGC